MPWFRILRALWWQECVFYCHCGGYLIYGELTETASQVGEQCVQRSGSRTEHGPFGALRIWSLELEQRVGGKQGQDYRVF